MIEVADMTQIDVQSIIDRLKAVKAGDKTVEPVSIEELRRAIEAQRAIAVRPKAEKEEGASTSAKKPAKPKLVVPGTLIFDVKPNGGIENGL